MDSTLNLIINAVDNASKVVNGISSNIQSSLKQAEGGSFALLGTVSTLGAGMIAFGATSLKAFSDYQDEVAQTQAVLKSTGSVAGITEQSVLDLASAFQKSTKFSDDVTLSGQNLLLTFTNIGKDVFPQATETMLDMSQALGQDVKGSAIQLGKALQDPIMGVTALRRVGVNFSQSQQDVIKSLVETGRSAEAQAMILKELQTEFGGSAKAAGQTFSGQLVILQHEFEDLQKSIGQTIQEAIFPLMKAFTQWVDSMGGVEGILVMVKNKFNDLQAYIPIIIEMILAGLVPAFLALGGSMLATIAPLIPVILILGGAMELMRQAWVNNWGGIQEKVGGAIEYLKVKFEEFKNVLEELSTGEYMGDTFYNFALSLGVTREQFQALTSGITIALGVIEDLKTKFTNITSGSSIHDFLLRLKNTFEQVKTTITNVVNSPGVQGFIKIVGEKIQGIIKNLIAAFIQMKPHIDTLISKFAGWYEKLKPIADVVNKVMVALMIFQAFVVGVLIVVLVSLIEKFTEFAGPILSFVIDAVGEMIDFIVNGISNLYNFWAPIIQEMGNIIKFVWDMIVTEITIAMDIINNLIVPVITLIVRMVGAQLQMLSDVFTSVFNWIMNNIVNPFVKWFMNNIYPTIAAVIGWIIGAFNSIVSPIQSAFDAVAGFINSIWWGIVNTMKSVFNVMIDQINGFIGGVNSMLEGLSGFGSLFNVQVNYRLGSIPHLANGADFIVPDGYSGDNYPFAAMLQSGERVQVTPRDQVNNNQKSVNIEQVIFNNNQEFDAFIDKLAMNLK